MHCHNMSAVHYHLKTLVGHLNACRLKKTRHMFHLWGDGFEPCIFWKNSILIYPHKSLRFNTVHLRMNDVVGSEARNSYFICDESLGMFID